MHHLLPGLKTKNATKTFIAGTVMNSFADLSE
jgi:hypothetical protein